MIVISIFISYSYYLSENYSLAPFTKSALLSSTPVFTNLATDDDVLAMDAGPDNTLYLGGTFDKVGVFAGNASIVDVNTGLMQNNFSMIDGGIVEDIVSDGIGGWYIAELDAVTGLATGWNAQLGVTNTFQPKVRSMFIDSGNIYIAGAWDTIGGISWANAASINVSTAAHNTA